MISVLNFAHPITPDQCDQIAAILNTTPDQVTVFDKPVQLDLQAPFIPQIEDIVRATVGAPPGFVVVNPPGLAPAAVLLLSELRRQRGLRISMLRLRPVAGATPTRFEVAEIIPLP